MNDLSSWKVYRMNDCDLVAAKSEVEAKDFYQEIVDREEVEEHFEGEANLHKEVVCVVTDDLTKEEKERVIRVLGEEILHEEEFKCTLAVWLEVEVYSSRDKPFIIASTEY